MIQASDFDKYFDPVYRLNNLYRIVTKEGADIPFRPNTVQSTVLEGLHTRNLILKARQLGMSTFAVLYLLDRCIWTPNFAGGIVSYSIEHAQHIFKRIIGHALNTLPIWLSAGITSQSAREISFSNGSFIRVDTSLRGGSYQLVLVSEYGKTCARSPLKAEEVITGTLQTLSPQAQCIIESTGEGSEGYFVDFVNAASLRGNEDLNPLEYKLFFFPWFTEPGYQLVGKVPYPVELTDYFNDIEKQANVKLSQAQRNWYASTKGNLGDKIKQEFPSTISEAFLSSSDAFYFATLVNDAERDNRLLYTDIYDSLAPVYVAMDIAVNDNTCCVFFQVIHGEIRIIDFLQDKGKGCDYYAKFLLQNKNYLYHTIFLPHDSARRDGLIVENSYEKEFKKHFNHTPTRIMVLPRSDKQIQIGNAKQKLSRCVFNINKTKNLISNLRKYRKKWSEQYGKYLDEPYHGDESDYADAFIYAMEGVSRVETVGSMKGMFEKHKEVTENRKYQI